ncbi:hypothetical protein A3K48_02160 [candidate division WOR-1 bacterium RIFOXYA12_FULL_52_29]|uniref:DUF4412 domain-containing protein n=1 Tax=candidate division WOR-1 bacterium RIFOXYC12_FULL_54_18 TaxID=1802584 RepID=A0A1F4T5H2_UNCSA|nr:MAG: hypothetical protein A3K44_02160 [candidate division WOR-1 bacterium RIFOXYA2_FULL_51_19]OGC17380.1 MAG: hypothetical protein A3K48_02160 [candidate division WOR-1 bacterium RIFOXYA12_FULL_52_29]OGC26239.1 MAG: hypothetical protein A3K32_02155 [candidate division WOR-1 bacterium RIFOXYB2_FULL_45_9]OGC27797.1 MAG: hypothetical protein A3K49_02160 [candidate division WOR-1 bacterium RIFOXYC12_FULL_54_18]OGC29914.1 MAG: hypothetical protein A2346_04175 [candidate division WOR-1 bacterium R
MFKKVLFSTLIGAVALSMAAAAMEFSADVVTKMKKQTMMSKMYMSGEKWRTETKAGKGEQIAIVRADKKVVWILMPDQKMYMEQKLTPDKTMGMVEKTPGEVSRKKIGREKINGIDCDKYLITYKGEDGESKMYQWLSGDKWPVKSAALDGSWSTEMKNIKKGGVSGKLFDIPAGYKKMPMPGMSGMKGMKPADMKKMMEGMKGMGM